MSSRTVRLIQLGMRASKVLMEEIIGVNAAMAVVWNKVVLILHGH